MKYLNLIAGCLFTLISFTAMAADMKCGTHMISEDEEVGMTKSDVIQKCGHPQEEHGNSMTYKHEGGSTYVLHFNDNGHLESIHVQ